MNASLKSECQGMLEQGLDVLLGVTYSEFDNAVGTQLLYEYPVGAITADAFEAVSEYVIVGKHLCEKIIMVTVENVKFLNFSVAIENAKYNRNTLSFALGFVLANNAITEPYESILRKLSAALISMEVEKEFLFNPLSKKQLGAFLLQNIFDGLRTVGELFVKFDTANILNMRLLRDPQSPRVVKAYDVPLLLHSTVAISVMPWDITVSKIIDMIDGKRTIFRIAEEANVDFDCASRCIRALLFYECVLLTDVFLFSNIYRGRTSLLNLRRVGNACDQENSNSNDIFRMMGSDLLASQKENIFRLLLALRPGVPLGKIITNNIGLLRGLDIPRVIAVALHTGLIERIRAHPLIKISGNQLPIEVPDEHIDKRKQHHTQSAKGMRSKPTDHTLKGKRNEDSFAGKKGNSQEKVNDEYYAGPCLDDILCQRKTLQLSEDELEQLQKGPFLYI